MYNPHKKLGSIYSVWKPGKNICTDEQMIPFREKVHFEVYNGDKPEKYGVKSYQLNDSSDGLCCRIEIYTSVHKNPPSTKGKTYILEMRLIKPYLSVG